MKIRRFFALQQEPPQTLPGKEEILKFQKVSGGALMLPS
jgi:hypothetical protein